MSTNASSRRLLRRHYQIVVAGACAVIALSLASLSGGRTEFDGRLFDLAVAARAQIQAAPTAAPPVMVVALDGKSLNSEELRALPRVFFGPYWAKMLDGLFAAGAGSVGFDIIFAYNANAFRIDHDTIFLQALARYRDRIVFARSADIDVALPYSIALDLDGEAGSIAQAEMVADRDLVYRRTSRLAPGGAETDLSLAAAVLARAGIDDFPDKLLLAPRQHLEALPTYSFIDVLRCSAIDPVKLSTVVASKIVFVGTNLPEEDRKIASDRFIPRHEKVPADRNADGCSLTPLGPSDPNVATVPGVHLHAAAANIVATGDIVRPVPLWVLLAFVTVLAFFGALLGASAGGRLSISAAALVVALVFCVIVLVLMQNHWLPGSEAMIAAAASVGVGQVTRYVFFERRRQRVEKAFDHYLSPHIVAQLADEDTELQLGGNSKEITVMFADLSGFTRLSTQIDAGALVDVMNRHFEVIVDAVESHGGYVDKFIGDNVMAFWGAPVADPDHATNAVRAAIAAAENIIALHARERGAGTLSIKIGINSGSAIVGNIGATNRYNYTTVGETVNIAARLESVPAQYGCRIVLGEATAERVRHTFVLSEIDSVQLKGISSPISVFEPITAVESADDTDGRYVSGYERALAALRHGDRKSAIETWQSLSRPTRPHLDAVAGAFPSTVMAERAQKL